MRKVLFGCFAALSTFKATLAGVTPALSQNTDSISAVAVMYHRFGENRYPSTNIRLDQFERHLEILEKEDYNVVPLKDIVDAIKSRAPIPPKTVALTVDDAYASAFTEAWPRVKAHGWTMTVFVSTEAVDAKRPGYMSWEQIRTLKNEGVTIGAHTKSHAHMAKLDKLQALTEIAGSNGRFKAELGSVPKLFAYPYGEANLETISLTKRTYDAAFGQHSGVLTAGENMYFLPRYALNENYGSEDRFRLVINTLPIKVDDVVPANPTLKHNPPYFGFTVDDPKVSTRGLKCYGSNPGATDTEILGRRIEVRLEDGFTGTRGRINCTTLGPNGQWRWFGRLFYLPTGIRRNGAVDD